MDSVLYVVKIFYDANFQYMNRKNRELVSRFLNAIKASIYQVLMIFSPTKKVV